MVQSPSLIFNRSSRLSKERKPAPRVQHPPFSSLLFFFVRFPYAPRCWTAFSLRKWWRTLGRHLACLYSSCLDTASFRQGAQRKSWRQRFFVLRTDGTLRYYKDEKEYRIHPGSGAKVCPLAPAPASPRVVHQG